MKPEPRKYARRTLQLDIELAYLADRPIIVKTRDISDGGIFILTDRPDHYQLNEYVTLRYKNPFHRSAIAEKRAVIVRRENEGFAVAFTDQECASRSALQYR